MLHTTSKPKASPLFVIFTTVLIDLIGFGMVIPLIGLYGRHYGGSGLRLPILGGIYSLMQFFFAPLWGRLSDQMGRRPILLISLAGSTLSYLLFGLAPNFTWLLIGRAFGGIFAANISTAQAYIADITTPNERAKGMGLIGAAFGIGFTLGPPLGGIASAKLGLSAPGFIAAAICGINFCIAFLRLPESLPLCHREKKTSPSTSPSWFCFSFKNFLDCSSFLKTIQKTELGSLLMTFFFVTFAFSTMEQTFSLLFQKKFNLLTGEAGLKTGMILMSSGIMGAVVQGGLIRRLIPVFGEKKLLLCGLLLNFIGMFFFPYGSSYFSYFFLMIPLSLGTSLIHPCLTSLISQSVGASQQGSTMGISQGLGSLARALGPFIGLITFSIQAELPYFIASFLSLSLLIINLKALKNPLLKKDRFSQ